MSKTRDPESTRNSIMKAAEQIFVQQGFAATSMSSIARKANVTKSLIHHHFGTKKNLWNEIKHRQFSQFASVQSSLLESSDMDTGLLKESIIQYFRFLQKNPQHSRFLLWMKIEADDTCGDMANEMTNLGIKSLQKAQEKGLLRSDVDPLFILMIFLGMAELWFETKHQFLRPGIESEVEYDHADEAYLEAMLEIFFKGVLPRENSSD
ncbi:MAG: TetR/AcrR family transcriptional regulator [Deltaproteobacteria bacterium]|nr:TetR/AcrR family transcriptional regulator [Deltaproteobacteria bacterium]